MAGDWIKMRADLFTHPKVVRIASALKADTLRTVGGLMSVWCLFDAHSEDGRLEGYTTEVLDAHLRWDGFASAMIDIGWLAQDEAHGLVLPRFDTHNGQSAKRRAQDADRKREVRKESASEADKKRTREEKRREEKNTPQPPNGGGELPGFAQFWQTWPNTDRKQAKGKCLDVWKKASAERDAAVILAHVERMKSSASWTKNGGEYIPAPLVYLNQRRWEGADASESQTGDMWAGAT